METQIQNPDDQHPTQEEGPESQNQYLDPDRDDLTYGIDPDKKPFYPKVKDQNNHPLHEKADSDEEEKGVRR